MQITIATMAPKKLLVINPNSSKSMTDSLDQLIKDLDQEITTSTQIQTYTAPSGPPSINNEDDALESAKIVLKDLEASLSDYDAYLVACYSVHPLVGMLRDKISPHIHVTGIFEASISTSLSLLPLKYDIPSNHQWQKFGIVSTGTYWEKALSDGVKNFLDLQDLKSSGRFKGVETTGLNAIELHTAPPEVVRRKMMEATKRLVKDRDVKIVCLGCAGMAGLDGIVEEALVEELGEEDAEHVHVLDGVKAGIGALESLLRALPAKRK
jgi:Asp/Glu/hydantoin racemase